MASQVRLACAHVVSYDLLDLLFASGSSAMWCSALLYLNWHFGRHGRPCRLVTSVGAILATEVGILVAHKRWQKRIFICSISTPNISVVFGQGNAWEQIGLRVTIVLLWIIKLIGLPRSVWFLPWLDDLVIILTSLVELRIVSRSLVII